MKNPLRNLSKHGQIIAAFEDRHPITTKMTTHAHTFSAFSSFHVHRFSYKDDLFLKIIALILTSLTFFKAVSLCSLQEHLELVYLPLPAQHTHAQLISWLRKKQHPPPHQEPLFPKSGGCVTALGFSGLTARYIWRKRPRLHCRESQRELGSLKLTTSPPAMAHGVWPG